VAVTPNAYATQGVVFLRAKKEQKRIRRFFDN
jgi:hypothetical protein